MTSGAHDVPCVKGGAIHRAADSSELIAAVTLSPSTRDFRNRYGVTCIQPIAAQQ